MRPGAGTENEENCTAGQHHKVDTSSPFSAAVNGGHVLTAALNRQNCLFLKDCIREPHSEWPRAALAFPRKMLKGTRRLEAGLDFHGAIRG